MNDRGDCLSDNDSNTTYSGIHGPTGSLTPLIYQRHWAQCLGGKDSILAVPTLLPPLLPGANQS